MYEHNRQVVSLPGWYFSVYPARRPLFCIGGPHSRVRESKLGLMAFRKDGGPGTEKQHHSHSQGWNIAPDLFMGIGERFVRLD